MKNPIKILSHEHEILMSAVKLGHDIQNIEDQEIYSDLIKDFIMFIRNYSEIYHFPKEENIFYPMLRHLNLKMDPAFMHEICDNHEDFKALIAEIENHYSNFNFLEVRKTIKLYLVEMDEHMIRENKIILSKTNTCFNEKELELIYDKFIAYDQSHSGKVELEKDLERIRLFVSKINTSPPNQLPKIMREFNSGLRIEQSF